MISDGWLVWALTLLFGATGAWSVARCVAPGALAAPTGVLHRSTCLCHAVMAVGMILMLWPWGTGVPRWLQLIVFGTAAVFFLVRAAAPRSGQVRVTMMGHAAMMLAMVWMVFAMPASTGSGGATMPMADMPGMTMPGTTATGHPGAVVLVSGTVVALLLGAFTLRSTAEGIQLTRTVTSPAASGPRTPLPRTPVVEAAGHAAMGLGMTVMTVSML